MQWRSWPTPISRITTLRRIYMYRYTWSVLYSLTMSSISHWWWRRETKREEGPIDVVVQWVLPPPSGNLFLLKICCDLTQLTKPVGVLRPGNAPSLSIGLFILKGKKEQRNNSYYRRMISPSYVISFRYISLSLQGSAHG